ncbi:DUF5818 domain-containing protein [uncultured Sphingomonas sp.]|uniref:DUF5818 domain-containing protein n=1 Tax=uncultured Sphingomonas sp. TaxID=158754 RepID=UPI0035C9D4F5
MPRGTRHELTGLLFRDGPTLILRVDGGGEWRLDAPTHAWRLVGRRVSVTGVRDDFDLLGVQRLKICKGESGPRGGAIPAARDLHPSCPKPLHLSVVPVSFEAVKGQGSMTRVRAKDGAWTCRA